MNPPERFPPDDPREWINRAQSNLMIARQQVMGAYLEDLCFQAQQAAEKAIKAVMIARGIQYPHIHDLGRLLYLLEGQELTIPEEIRLAGDLTPFAVTTRYPSVADEVTREDYASAIKIAEAVVNWATDQIRLLASESDVSPANESSCPVSDNGDTTD